MMTRVLAVDIGGTNSRFAVFEVRDGRLADGEQIRLPTVTEGGFAGLIDRAVSFGLSVDPDTVACAVVAVAGPVEHGSLAHLPNAGLSVDAAVVRERLGINRVSLINDFVAQAHACLSPAALASGLVQDGEALPDSALAIVGAGTGLGHCALIPDGRGGYTPAPSEAGHAAFPFTAAEADIQQFFQNETGVTNVYVEAVVSGPGLARLHKHLTGRDLTPPEAAAELGPGSLTSEIFARFYGRACRNYVLATLARGGLFVSGGVAGRNPFLVDHDAFRKEFAACPDFAGWLSRLPVRLVRRDDFGLWGAAMRALAEIQE